MGAEIGNAIVPTAAKRVEFMAPSPEDKSRRPLNGQGRDEVAGLGSLERLGRHLVVRDDQRGDGLKMGCVAEAIWPRPQVAGLTRGGRLLDRVRSWTYHFDRGWLIMEIL